MMRKGDWMQTFSGVQFWPLDPRPEDVRLDDIMHALSNLCRFGGHCRYFYSVAQHSVMVSRQAEAAARTDAREVAIIGLLHDATEAYLIDVPRPIKRDLLNYKEIETALAVTIGERFGVRLDLLPDLVKEADERALFTEKRDLLCKEPAPWGVAQGVSNEPYPERIEPQSPYVAKQAFFARAVELGFCGESGFR